MALKDVVKPGIKAKFAELRKMEIKTVMVTGDNPLTAAAIAAEAGVDDFVAEATPETKIRLIQKYQEVSSRNDGRWHKRRSGSRASGCGLSHEQRHPIGKKSGEYDRFG